MKEQSEKDKDRAAQADGKEENAAEEKKGEQFSKLDTKALPAITMLFGGAVASVMTYLNHYTLTEMLVIVLVSLIGFYILGAILKKIFDSFKIPIKKEKQENSEGEVIEKEPDTGTKEKTDQVTNKG